MGCVTTWLLARVSCFVLALLTSTGGVTTVAAGYALRPPSTTEASTVNVLKVACPVAPGCIDGPKESGAWRQRACESPVPQSGLLFLAIAVHDPPSRWIVGRGLGGLSGCSRCGLAVDVAVSWWGGCGLHGMTPCSASAWTCSMRPRSSPTAAVGLFFVLYQLCSFVSWLVVRGRAT